MKIRRLLGGAGAPAKDRRGSPRNRCRLHCTVGKGRKRFRARVVDVSEGGICLLSPHRLELKRSYALEIDVPRHGPLAVQAVAWHLREVKPRERANRGKSWSVGMMLSETPPEFEALLPGATSRAGQEGPGAAPAPAEASVADPPDEQACDPSESESPPDPALGSYRVRVKAVVGPRSRVLTLTASSLEEAETLARTDLDDSWQILEVTPSESALQT